MLLLELYGILSKCNHRCACLRRASSSHHHPPGAHLTAMWGYAWCHLYCRPHYWQALGTGFIITGAAVKVPVRYFFCKHRPPFWVAYTQECNRGVRGLPGFARHGQTAFQDGCAAGHSTRGTLSSRHTTRSSTLRVCFQFSPPRGGEEGLSVAIN